MREPAFWWRQPSWMSHALTPVGAVYGAISGYRMTRKGRRAAVPVICVGNYSLGGAGKTPTVLALVKLLRAAGETPAVLSRGYGGKLAGPLLVDAEKRTATDVGDEPLLLARAAPVVVSRDRVRGADAACEGGASVIVMDDGLQNSSLHKDLVLAVIDGSRGIGNANVFPAGPLRAPLATQLDRTDVLVISGRGARADDLASQLSKRGALILRSQVVPDPDTIAALRGTRVMAFAGIGDPERFFATLRGCGIDVAARRSFADHHQFTAREIAQLVEEARASSLRLVTTEKDLVRLKGMTNASSVRALPITLVVDDEARLRELLAARLARARAEIGDRRWP